MFRPRKPNLTNSIIITVTSHMHKLDHSELIQDHQELMMVHIIQKVPDTTFFFSQLSENTSNNYTIYTTT